MSFFYELLGRAVWSYVQRRYRRELMALAGVGVAAVLLGGYVVATRPVKEG